MFAAVLSLDLADATPAKQVDDREQDDGADQ
jgi:hypothetical protein